MSALKLFEHVVRDSRPTGRSWRVTVDDGEVRVDPAAFPPHMLDAIVRAMRRAAGHVKAGEQTGRRLQRGGV